MSKGYTPNIYIINLWSMDRIVEDDHRKNTYLRNYEMINVHYICMYMSSC